MGEMTIRHVDDALLHDITAAADRIGSDPSSLVLDMVAYMLSAGPRVGATERTVSDAMSIEERERRQKALADLRATRAMTLKPLQFDSTLLIRELRDADD